MKLTTYEIVGIAASVAIMAVVLWLVNVQSATTLTNNNATNNTPVFVGEGENQQAALADALLAAGGTDGEVNQLVIDDVVIGDGDAVEAGDTVTVDYIGTLTNGTQVASTYKTGQPLTLTLKEGRVIDGWREGLVGMRVGGQRVLVIPPEMGYGNAGGGPIPANATLVFAVELLSIE